MSAIAGILSFGDVRHDPGVIHALGAALRHRGPDGQAFYAEGRISLAHCALHATPEAQHEKQPLHDAESGCTLVFDGRLDNRAELIAALALPSAHRAASDPELILAAYQQWGTGLPAHLLGDFAFAVWDARRQRLFCARDPMGAAGFAYVHSDRLFAFATESEALLAVPGVGSEPNENRIASIFVSAFENLGDRRTWLREVQALFAGESLQVLADGTVSIERYWAPANTEPRRYGSYADCEAHFLSVFGQALRDRLRGRGDVAMMLSGGLDSAGIIGMLQRLGPEFPGRRCDGYSAIADDVESCIESRSILSLARTTGARLHTVAVPSIEGMVSVQDLIDAAWAKPHPVANPILILSLMSLAARRDGHRTILHGACGDIAMSAPRYYPAVHLRRGRVGSAWRESKAASVNNLFLQGRPPARIFARSLALALAPNPVLRGWRALRFRRRPPVGAGTLLKPEFAAHIRLDEQLAEQFYQDEAQRQRDERRFLLSKRVQSVCSALSAANLVAGRAGLEARDPWSDTRVVELFFRMPDAFKIQDGWTKFPVRSAFRAEIAPLVLQRSDKSHLGWKFTIRLLGEMHHYLQNELERQVAVIEEYVDVQALLEQNRRLVEHGDYSQAHSIYNALTLLRWLERIKSV